MSNKENNEKKQLTRPFLNQKTARDTLIRVNLTKHNKKLYVWCLKASIWHVAMVTPDSFSGGGILKLNRRICGGCFFGLSHSCCESKHCMKAHLLPSEPHGAQISSRGHTQLWYYITVTCTHSVGMFALNPADLRGFTVFAAVCDHHTETTVRCVCVCVCALTELCEVLQTCWITNEWCRLFGCLLSEERFNSASLLPSGLEPKSHVTLQKKTPQRHMPDVQRHFNLY